MNAGAAMSKRGRPKSDRPMIDHGTEQLRLHKFKLVNGGDPALAEYPLGILLARKLIDQDQHQAGEKYAGLYAKAIGRMRELGFDPGRGNLQDSDLERIEAQFIDCREKLRRCGLKVKQLVEAMAIYREVPLWITTNSPCTGGTFGFDDLTRIKYGLDKLADTLVRKRGG